MPCTTLLVGRKASYDGSTMIARTDDGYFDVKKIVVEAASEKKRKYKSVISHCTVDLPEKSLRYTLCPSVDPKHGIWAACGINSAKVGMTATETITTNPLVMGGDPYVVYKKASRNQKEVIGGLGEEDFVICVLPYIHSAREGVERLGALLEQYGTYEANGIGFNDEKECWWLETIGGHHWIARRVKDEEVVVAPNRFNLDHFDFDDAYGAKKNFMCSADLKAFVEKYHLTTTEGTFNPRYAFGSHSDADRVYNNPRSWFMGRYFCPTTYKWDGPDADYTPECPDIPFAFVPEHKVTIEDVKYVLSSYYQGTPYNPHQKAATPQKGLYRPIGISRTGVTGLMQIRKGLPALEWISFGCNAYNAMIPLYTDVPSLPDYFSKVSLEVSTENFYWSSRLVEAMADQNFGVCVQDIERYQNALAYQSHEIINRYDALYQETKDEKLFMKANAEMAKATKEETSKILNRVLLRASEAMVVGYKRADV